MQTSDIVEAVADLSARQLAFVLEAAIQRIGRAGEPAIDELRELLAGRPEDGDFVDGLQLLQDFVTDTA